MAPSAPSDRETLELQVRQVRDPLVEILRQHETEAGVLGGEPGSARFRDAAFAMVALADDLLLAEPWYGREIWERFPLEEEIFGSHLAGELFFERAEELLRRAQADERPVAWVYLTALELGFEGRFRGAQDRTGLDTVREALRRFVLETTPETREPNRLSDEPYDALISHAPGPRIPDPRRWLLALGVIVGLYTLASAWIWTVETSPLGDTLDRIEEASSPAQPPEETGR